MQPQQTVFISALVEHAPLARALAASAYRAGARLVDVRYVDNHLRRAFIEHAPENELAETTPWHLARTEALLEGGALILISGDPEPRLLEGLDPRRIARAQPVQAAQLQLRAQQERAINWTIATFPTSGQAQQVFGEPDVERLWSAVAHCVRLDEVDPVAAWRTHLDKLTRRCGRLNELSLDELRFFGGGTDLRVGLLPFSHWNGGRISTRDGIEHVPNLPTEEVYACPDWRRTEGTVHATRPLPIGGTIVEDLELTFSAGRIIDVTAAAGTEAVEAEFENDERARYLGEVALVDCQSRVGQTGLLFYNGLFDENAASHLAWGEGLTLGLPDVEGLEPTELLDRGINVARTHTDFMIGSPEVSVDGITRDGTVIPLLRNDVWQIG